MFMELMHVPLAACHNMRDDSFALSIVLVLFLDFLRAAELAGFQDQCVLSFVAPRHKTSMASCFCVGW